MAEDGLLDNVVILAVNVDGGITSCWANDEAPFTVIGGLESLKGEFMDSCIEKR